MFFRRKTKENHTKSVQNVRKLVFSLGKTKEKQQKKKDHQKKKDPKQKSTQRVRPCFCTQGKVKHNSSSAQKPENHS